MSARLSFIERNSASCPRCGQSTVHIRDLCRTCDPCTATLLLAVVEASLSADRTLEPSGIVAELTEGRSAERKLSA